MMKKFRALWRVLFFVVLSFLTPAAALYSATLTWTGLGTTNNWNLGTNWNAGGDIPVMDDTAVFPVAFSSSSSLLTNNFTIELLNTSQATNYTLTGSLLSFDGPNVKIMASSLILKNDTMLPSQHVSYTATTSMDIQGNVSGNPITFTLEGGGTFNLTNTVKRFTGDLFIGTATTVYLRTALTTTGAFVLDVNCNLHIQAPIRTTLITGTGLLLFDGNQTVTYPGNIRGSVRLSVGPGTNLTLTGNILDYDAGTQVDAGAVLDLRGNLSNAGTALQTRGGIFTGNGTVAAELQNVTGTVRPGISSSTALTVGSYTQTQSTLDVRINPLASSKLIVTGGATLDNILLLTTESGIYQAGTQYTILTTGTGITNDFTTVVGSHTTSANWRTQIVGNNYRITLRNHHIVTPHPLTALDGNSAVVGNYMYADPNFILSNPDLKVVGDEMLTLNALTFSDALVMVSPLAYGANPQVGLQTSVQMAVVLDKQFQKVMEVQRWVAEAKENEMNEEENENESQSGSLYSSESEKYNTGAPCIAIPKTGLFIEPIGVFYHQKETGGALSDVGQVAFDSYTYGAGLGWEQVLNEKFVIEGGIGYTHSNLHWKQGFGNSKWSTLYLAPFFGWFNERYFANFMVMAGFNFFNTDRKVSFADINRTAHSRYNSYDLLLRFNGGGRIAFGDINWFQPEVTLNYLTIFTEGYTERGAGSINLEVKRNTAYIMQPSFRGKWIQEFKTEKFCYSPILYVGWLANIMLQQEDMSARFTGAPNRIFFNIQGYTKTTNQLILGAEFFAQRFNKFEITGTFEVDMLSHFEVYTGKVRFEWMF